MNNPPAIAPSILVDRLRSELKLKLILTGMLIFWFGGPYYFLQWHHFFPTTPMPESFCDRVIPFSGKAVWIYMSVYLLMPIGPFLMTRRRQIIRYAAGLMLIGALADLVFIVRPTWCPRPGVSGTSAAYQMLIAVDNPFNAFPSLHAAFAVYSALCAGLVLRELRSHALWRSALWLWAFLILFATLATKQHMMADIVAGSVLAVVVYVCVFDQWKWICRHSQT